jgi:RNA polymerase sigma factor (sigma-70 family)
METETVGSKEMNLDMKREVRAEIKGEEIVVLQERTLKLFQVIEMCRDNKEQVQVCRNEIIELNIRLVPRVLQKYKPFGDDEFQLGCLGLIVATRTFDPARGVPYASYACFCIERELHKAHRKQSNSFEYQIGNGLSSLDQMAAFQNGDVSGKYDVIPDIQSEEDFDKVLEDFCLTNLFDKVIMPSIDSIAGATKGQQTTVDFDKWKQLELTYILEMAEVNSQKARITLSKIAKDLGVSVQNIRMRHKRVINNIRSKCEEAGITIGEDEN